MAGAISPKSPHQRIFISAGEASGDALGGALIQRLAALNSNLTFEGVGGAKMAESGARIVANSRHWGAISILESLKVAPRVMAGYRQAKSALFGGIPGLFVAIDFGFVNVRLIKFAKAYGWKTLYFMPPGSWRRPEGDRPCKRPAFLGSADAIVTPFAWSEEWLKGFGADVHWFGHPLKELLAVQPNSVEPINEGAVVFLPGSRNHELGTNLPLFAELAKTQAKTVLVVAPNLSLPKVEAIWRRSLPDRAWHQVVQRPVIEVLQGAKAAVVCSGTAALEAALCGCPHLVMYKFPPIAEWEAKLVGFKMPKYIGMGNIILDRPAIPEFIQAEATLPNLSSALEKIIADTKTKQDQAIAFDQISQALGGNRAISQTAELALKLLQNP